jgi:hypothetical protein
MAVKAEVPRVSYLRLVTRKRDGANELTLRNLLVAPIAEVACCHQKGIESSEGRMSAQMSMKIACCNGLIRL